MQTVWFPIAGYWNAASVVNFAQYPGMLMVTDAPSQGRGGFQPNLLIGIGHAGAVAHQSACDELLMLRAVERRGRYDDGPDILSAAPR
jgi:hypothetical protein